jgi:phage terminase large subunit-like protein
MNEQVPRQWIKTVSDEMAASQGCYFDPTFPQRVETLAWNYLTRKTGPAEFVPFEWLPWFRDLVWRFFGWRMPDGSRRHWYCYCFVPRGNAKSSSLAPLLAILPFVEPLPANCEINVVSPTIDQSSIIWGYAESALRPPDGEPSELITSGEVELQPYYRRLHYPRLGVTLKLKAKETNKSTRLDGFTGPGILEELHGVDQSTVDTVTESADKLPSPMVFAISTAGRTKRGPCWEKFKRCLELIDGKAADIRTLPIMYAVPEGDGWMDFEQVKAANPGLGVTIREEVLRKRWQDALDNPKARPSFRQKNCDQWTEAASRWLNWTDWSACRRNFAELPDDLLRRLPCYLGIDLSKRNDLCTCAAIWPDATNGILYFKPTFWLPNRGIEEKSLRDEADYKLWADAGDLTLLNAEVIDFDFIGAHVRAIAAGGNLQAVGFDRKYASYLMNDLQRDGIDCRVIYQGGKLADACRELETRIETGTIVHDGNAVIGYCIENVCLTETANGGCFPSKENESSPLRIDGVTALVIALKALLLAGGGLPSANAHDLAAARTAEAESLLANLR